MPILNRLTVLSAYRLFPPHHLPSPYTIKGSTRVSSLGSLHISSRYTSIYHRRSSTSKSYKSPHSEPILRAAIGTWHIAALFGIFGGAYFIYTQSALPTSSATQYIASSSTSEAIEALPVTDSIWQDMSGETLPGRPGTLTPEQDEKLREFWLVTAKLIGRIDENEPMYVEYMRKQGGDDDTISTTGGSKRSSIFRRSKNKKVDVPNTAEEGDKYNQSAEFQAAVASYTPAELREVLWKMCKHDNPDALLLRFLRARKWNVERALIMMISTMSWRGKEMQLDNGIMRKGELGWVEDADGKGTFDDSKLGKDVVDQMRMGKSFLHGLDKEGRPICLVRARMHKIGAQSSAALEAYTVYLIETTRMIISPPVDTGCIIFDLTGFGLSNMDYSPVQFMIKCFEANYPESLGVVLVHKAPWVFQGFWKIVRGWLDPVVANKVHFTNSVDDLAVYIDRSRILKELGGDEDWTYEYIEPKASDDDLMKDTKTRDAIESEREVLVKKYEDATDEWLRNPSSAEVRKRRFDLADEMRRNYWRLDPYVRARSWYDRSGVLLDDGKIQFYEGEVRDTLAPPQKGGAVGKAVVNGGVVHSVESDVD